jgi:hypothetical protein
MWLVEPFRGAGFQGKPRVLAKRLIQYSPGLVQYAQQLVGSFHVNEIVQLAVEHRVLENSSNFAAHTRPTGRGTFKPRGLETSFGGGSCGPVLLLEHSLKAQPVVF